MVDKRGIKMVQTIVACGGRKCCPKIHIYRYNNVVIEDDDKNKVSMTKKQALEMARGILREVKV